MIGVVKLFVCFSQIVLFGPNYNGSTFIRLFDNDIIVIFELVDGVEIS